MPIPVLDQCFDLQATRTDTGALSVAAPDSQARRQKLFEDTPLETWQLTFSEMNESEAAQLLLLFQQVGFTRPFAWQPPNAASAAAYRFDQMRITKNAGNTYRADASVQRQLSVQAT